MLKIIINTGHWIQMEKHLLSGSHGLVYSNSNIYPSIFRAAAAVGAKHGYLGDFRSNGLLSLRPFGYNLVDRIATSSRHNQIKVRAAGRRRRSNQPSDTYVLLEPGEEEKFVSKEELEAILKGWLENWPAALPPDLSRFESTEEAVSFLLKSVCELEIDGDVGSIQWYQVRLE